MRIYKSKEECKNTSSCLINKRYEYAASIRTYLRSLEELVLSSREILGLAGPGAEHGSLEGTTEAEGQSPWLLAGELVDGVQVDGGLLLGLSTAEESDSGYCWGYGAGQGGDGGGSDFLGCRLLRAALAGCYHVRLEEGALEVDMVVSQCLKINDNIRKTWSYILFERYSYTSGCIAT